jgi:hypothetical protein
VPEGSVCSEKLLEEGPRIVALYRLAFNASARKNRAHRSVGRARLTPVRSTA